MILPIKKSNIILDAVKFFFSLFKIFYIKI